METCQEMSNLDLVSRSPTTHPAHFPYNWWQLWSVEPGFAQGSEIKTY